jgi:hypothetical protein
VNLDPEDSCDEWLHPFSLAAQANASSDDTTNWYQAMNEIHADGYKEAMQVEYETLLSKHAWTEVKRKKWMNVVPSTWAFKCKRYPDGSVRKLKARFCVHGDKQVEGVDYFDTYAPVMTWTIVRILLILPLIRPRGRRRRCLYRNSKEFRKTWHCTQITQIPLRTQEISSELLSSLARQAP